MGTTSGVVQPLYIKSKTLYHIPTTKCLPDYLRNNQTNYRKTLNYHPHTIHWVQNLIRVPEGSTMRLCVNPRPNLHVYQGEYFERIYHPPIKGHTIPMIPNTTHNSNPNCTPNVINRI